VFTTSGSAFDTIMGVYTGSSVGALTTLADNDDEDYDNAVYTSRVTLAATAGVTYYIAVDGYNDGVTGAVTGNVRLQWFAQ
jgi:hypothetical protein